MCASKLLHIHMHLQTPIHMLLHVYTSQYVAALTPEPGIPLCLLEYKIRQVNRSHFLGASARFAVRAFEFRDSRL